MRRVTTYERLHRHVAAWVDREIDRLLILGKPGFGKSSSYKQGLGNRPHHIFGGHLSPLQLYLQLCDDPRRPIVLDDISLLLKQDVFRDMLKALCETGERIVRWNTTSSKLRDRPKEVRCTAPVLIVLNEIPARHPDVVAILDRFDAISFEPTKAEVIGRMIELFPDDGDIIDLLIELPAMPTLRTLVRARNWRNSRHLNMVEELLGERGVPEPVAQLVEIMLEAPESQWCTRYVEATGLTDRTYRRHKYVARQIVECRTP